MGRKNHETGCPKAVGAIRRENREETEVEITCKAGSAHGGTMSKIKQIPQSPPAKEVKKFSIPISHEELHQAVDTILATPNLSRAFGDCLLLTFWTVKIGSRARQVEFARAMSRFLDTWTQSGSKE
jgi:hypothetical protein